MKTKNYLRVIVKRHDGTYFLNPLKLSEAHLLNKLARENADLSVSFRSISIAEYKAIFG
jgi:molybdopterin biosynthesis enzyme